MNRRWVSVDLPKDPVEIIDRYLETEQGRQRGFTSRNDVVITAVRDLLQRGG